MNSPGALQIADGSMPTPSVRRSERSGRRQGSLLADLVSDYEHAEIRTRSTEPDTRITACVPGGNFHEFNAESPWQRRSE